MQHRDHRNLELYCKIYYWEEKRSGVDRFLINNSNLKMAWPLQAQRRLELVPLCVLS